MEKLILTKKLFRKDLNEILQNLYSTNFFENVEISLQNGILKVDLVEFSILGINYIRGGQYKL